MHRAGADVGLEVYLVGKEGEAEGIALPHQELHQQRSGIGCKSDFVGVGKIGMALHGVVHRRRLVYEQLAAKIGFFLKTLHKQLVGTAIELPIDVLGRFAYIVKAMLGKFDRKPVKRTFMQPRNITLNYLVCKEVEGFIFLYFLKHLFYSSGVSLSTKVCLGAEPTCLSFTSPFLMKRTVG